MVDGPWVLVVLPDDAERAEVGTALAGEGFRVRATASPAEALDATQPDVAVVLVDDAVDAPPVAELVRILRTDLPRAEVLVATRDGARRALGAGLGRASDYVERPWDRPHELVRSVRHAVQAGALRLAKEVARSPSRLLGDSDAMVHLRQLVERVAATSAPVLVTGESGVGKEVVAAGLHELSRRTGEFVRVNCAALPEALIEAELFGAREGSYSGQKGAREGLFAHAENGTVFLDEIGEMPIGLQPKLLRVLENQTYRPIGAQSERKLSARVVAATNADLQRAIALGRFREDLYFRLAVLSLHLPPLRERLEDVPLLARHFAKVHAAAERRGPLHLTDEAVARLVAYEWPGNVRELSNVVLRAVVLCRGSEIQPVDLEFSRRPSPRQPEARPSPRPAPPAVAAWDPWLDLPLREARAEADAAFTRAYLSRRIAESDGNLSRAAARSEVLRPNFKRLMRKVGVGPKREPG